MRVLGIDQSYNSSGIVVLDGDNIIYSECYKSDKSKNRFGQAHEIALHIGTIFDEFKPDLVAIEGLAYGIRGNILMDLSGLQYAIIIHIQEIKKQTVNIISPTALKKFAVGHGKATKSEMIEKLPEHILNRFKDLGYKKTTGLSDLCDSYNICKFEQNKEETNNE